MKSAKEEQGQDGGQQSGPGKIQPDARKSQRPENDDENHGKEQGGGNGNDGRGNRHFYREHIALCGKGKPSRQIGGRKETHRALRHHKKLDAVPSDEQMGDLTGEKEEDDGGQDGENAACREAAPFDGAHTAVIARTPVITHRRLERIAHAVKQGLYEAVRIHQNPVNGNRVFSSDAQQDGVHQDRGDTSGNIIQKVRTSAGNDLTDQPQRKAGPPETKQKLSAKEGVQGNERADHHAKAGSKRSAPDAKAENAEEKELQNSAQNGHENIQVHASPDLAADAQIIIHGKYDGGNGRADSIDAEILNRENGEFSFRAHQTDQKRRCRKQDQSYNDARADDHQDSAGEYIICFLILFFPEADGDRHGGADADQVRKSKVDDHEGHGKIQRRKGGIAQKPAHKDAVKKLVQGRSQHADCAGDGGDKKQFCRCYTGE